MDDCEGFRQVGDDIAVSPLESGGAGNDDIVETVLCEQRRKFAQRRFQAAADAIAGNGVAELFGDREPEARAGRNVSLTR